MNRQLKALNMDKRALYRVSWVGAAGLLLMAIASPLPAAEGVVEIGRAAESRVPHWDARGLGPLPQQGIACLDASDDGRFVAVGTIAPPGVPNLFLLDENGRIVGQHRAGLRWLNEVTVSGDGRFVAALATTPEGTAGDQPRFYAFRDGKELAQLSERFRLQDFHPCGCMFHYGDHSNHLPHVARWVAGRWVVAGDDLVHWLSPDGSTTAEAPLGQGVTTAFAASASGLAVVGRYAFGSFYTPGEAASGAGGRSAVGLAGKFQNLLVLKPRKPNPVVWSWPASTDDAPSAKPEKGIYGPSVPPYEDVKFQAPLAVAVDAAGEHIAVADFEGWQRVFHPRDGSDDIPFGTRFMPSRPTIHVYDAQGKTVRRIGPEAFAEALWCDLAFSADGRKLLVWPHNWTSRGLAGQPLLPADEHARTLHVLDLADGGLKAVCFPDAIASVDTGGAARTAVGCWDHKVYLLDEGFRPIPTLPQGLDVGAASLVHVSRDGRRVTVATTAGTVRMLDGDGKGLWQTDLAKIPPPVTKKMTPGKLGPGIWRTGVGRYHSDMGTQILIEAPDGLILIDPNSAASLAENWAMIEGAGQDPRRVKYILPTHEHGDHAPGAALWRVISGAQVVASAEMAYVLQHHIPGGTGYGFHPPVPTDIVITGDKELDLAGLKVRAIRLPGHTYGSMGWVFRKGDRTYVSTGDLIMPGGVLGYAGSLDFSAEDVLNSLKKLALLRPDVVLGGHGGGGPDEFIAKGIAIGEATGWSKMPPLKPNPLYGFAQTNYLVAAWLEPIQAAAFGDVDGDGRPDVAVLVPKGKGSAVKIYLNRGGKFAAAPNAIIDLPDLPHAAKLRMLRLGDGRLTDFFVAAESQAVLLLAQQGDFKTVPLFEGKVGQTLALRQQRDFHFKTVLLPVIRGSQVAVGDFLGQGRRDLLIGSRFNAGFSIAGQGADGVFRLHTTPTTQSYMDIALANVNGDKREDLITSSGDIFLRQADGSLPAMPSFHLGTPAGEPRGWVFLAAADFDHDGWTDIALLANGKEGTIVWLYRNTRNPQAPFSTEPSARFVVPGAEVNRDGPTVADFNGDGIPDLLLCKRGNQPGVCVLAGSAADGLSPQRVLQVKLDYIPHYDSRFGVGDFKGDGRPALAGFGRAPTGAVGVYIWQQSGAAK